MFVKNWIAFQSAALKWVSSDYTDHIVTVIGKGPWLALISVIERQTLYLHEIYIAYVLIEVRILECSQGENRFQ